MLRTLYGKLSLALLGLIFLVSAFYVGLTVFTTRIYLQEVSQSLNAGLAANVVQDTVLMADHQIDEKAFKKAFDRLMHINPSVELYLLNDSGEILTFSTPTGRVARQRVSLAPLHAFLEGSRDFPILGEDPRDAGRQKVFSVAPILNAGALEGYLYVVLGGEAQDAVTRALQGSFILRLAAGIAVASALLTLAAGLLSFNFLTRRLRRLAAAMERFKQSGFRESVTLPAVQQRANGDEIDKLAVTFEQMSARMTDQIQQLEDADAARRELFANVSHDLRTPLAAMQGYLETLLIKGGDLTAAQRREYLDLAAKNSRRMGRLIHELFELATLEHPNSSLQVEAFSIAELVQDVSQKFRLAAEKKKLRLEVDIAESTPFVVGDIGLIERTLDNLIENAIKFTPPGGMVRLAIESGDKAVTARISDTGCGIAAADLPRIFDRFFRSKSGDAGAPEGTGLGLAIAKRTLQLHGSPIEVESEQGQGTTFSFQLNVAGPGIA